jgi:transcriptional regulator with XRE-family HTH domain
MSTLDGKFFSRLAEERKRLGYSQDSAGEVCGVSRKMWGNYEAGRNMPGADVLAAFMGAGADIGYILGGSRVGAAKTQEDLAAYNRGDIDIIVDAYAHTDDEGRAALLAVAKVLNK